MIWERTDLHHIESSEGYRVSVAGAGDDWVYQAQGPKRRTIGSSRNIIGVIDPIKGKILTKERYQPGDEWPWPREDLGTFHASTYGGTDAAKAAAVASCEAHRELVLEHQATAGTGPSQ